MKRSAVLVALVFAAPLLAMAHVSVRSRATYVLIQGADGWKIRHSHTSSRPRKPAGGERRLEEAFAFAHDCCVLRQGDRCR